MIEFLNKNQIKYLEDYVDSLKFKERKILNDIEDEFYGKILITNDQRLILYTSLPFWLSKNKIKKKILKKLWLDSCDKCETTTGKINVPSGCLCPEIFVIGIAPGFGNVESRSISRTMTFGISANYIRKALYDLKILDKVWFTNIIKCSLDSNRHPENAEIENCLFWLKEELRILKPKKIICLGNFAYEQFIKNIVYKYPMFIKGELQDSVHKIYHPAYYIRKRYSYKKYYRHVKEAINA